MMPENDKFNSYREIFKNSLEQFGTMEEKFNAVIDVICDQVGLINIIINSLSSETRRNIIEQYSKLPASKSMMNKIKKSNNATY
jgi:hypothetical protein